MLGGVLLPNAQHIQREAERSSPWRYRSQRLPRGSLRSPQPYQGVSAPPPLRHKGSVPMVLQGVCGLRAGESGSPVTSPSCAIPKRRWESKESLGVPTMSGVFPHPAAAHLHLESCWSPAGAETSERRMDRSACCARSSLLPSLPPLSRLYGLPPMPRLARSGCPQRCPSPTFPLLHVSGSRFYNGGTRRRMTPDNTQGVVPGDQRFMNWSAEERVGTAATARDRSQP